VVWEFEKIKGLRMEEIDITSLEGKRQRGELLVLLKDKGGLTYKEIREIDIYGEPDAKDSFKNYGECV
jgi:hypothetical protein